MRYQEQTWKVQATWFVLPLTFRKISVMPLDKIQTLSGSTVATDLAGLRAETIKLTSEKFLISIIDPIDPKNEFKKEWSLL